MDLWVAVDLRGGGEEEAGAGALGKAEHVDGAEDVGLDGFDGVVLVMDGAGGAGEMVDLVDFCGEGLGYVVAEELEAGMRAPSGEVLLLAREERVDDDDVMAILHETIDEMRADETRATGDQHALVVLLAVWGI